MSLDLSGETILFTGKLQRYTRVEALRVARKKGAITKSSWSNLITLLIVGCRPGGKLEKARAAGIRIIREEDFYQAVLNNRPFNKEDFLNNMLNEGLVDLDI